MESYEYGSYGTYSGSVSSDRSPQSDSSGSESSDRSTFSDSSGSESSNRSPHADSSGFESSDRRSDSDRNADTPWSNNYTHVTPSKEAARRVERAQHENYAPRPGDDCETQAEFGMKEGAIEWEKSLHATQSSQYGKRQHDLLQLLRKRKRAALRLGLEKEIAAAIRLLEKHGVDNWDKGQSNIADDLHTAQKAYNLEVVKLREIEKLAQRAESMEKQLAHSQQQDLLLREAEGKLFGLVDSLDAEDKRQALERRYIRAGILYWKRRDPMARKKHRLLQRVRHNVARLMMGKARGKYLKRIVPQAHQKPKVVPVPMPMPVPIQERKRAEKRPVVPQGRQQGSRGRSDGYGYGSDYQSGSYSKYSGYSGRSGSSSYNPYSSYGNSGYGSYGSNSNDYSGSGSYSGGYSGSGSYSGYSGSGSYSGYSGSGAYSGDSYGSYGGNSDSYSGYGSYSGRYSGPGSYSSYSGSRAYSDDNYGSYGGYSDSYSGYGSYSGSYSGPGSYSGYSDSGAYSGDSYSGYGSYSDYSGSGYYSDYNGSGYYSDYNGSGYYSDYSDYSNYSTRS